MEMTELGGGTDPALIISFPGVRTQKITGTDGFVDEIRFYDFSLVTYVDGPILFARTYVNRGDLDDAENGTAYSIRYSSTAADLEEALRMFKSELWTKFFEIFK